MRSSVSESETDESHGSGTILRLLLDGSAIEDAEEAANQAQEIDDVLENFNELCIVGVETTDGSNFGLEANE